MCSITHHLPGTMPPVTMIENAAYNNWHSFGLVVKKDGKLEIIKEVPESGEVDPKKVYDLLGKYKDYERFLHLRHNTAGATTLENTHPFDVYYDKKTKRHVVFMHNGTFYPYVSKKVVNACTVDDPDGPSDTKNFVDMVLIPYLTSMDFGKGKADIQNKLTQDLIKKFWNGANRGVLISSDQAPWFIDDWKEVGPIGNKFKASNDQYFEKVIRGPEYTRRLVREAQEKQTGQVARSNLVTNPFARLQDFQLDVKHGFYSLSESMVSIFDDWDVWDRSGAVALGYCSSDELKELYKDEASCIACMDWVFTDYAKLYKEYQELEEKHDRATKRIATMVAEKNAESQRMVG